MSRWNRNSLSLWCPLSSADFPIPPQSCYALRTAHSTASGSTTAMRCRPSNIQKYLRLPAIVVFLDRETMKRDRLHISALLMTCVVQLFAGESRFQNKLIGFLVDLHLVGSQ